jgi:hypothetical protein
MAGCRNYSPVIWESKIPSRRQIYGAVGACYFTGENFRDDPPKEKWKDFAIFQSD